MKKPKKKLKTGSRKKKEEKESASQILHRMEDEIDEYIALPEILDYGSEKEKLKRLAKEIRFLEDSSVLLLINPAEDALKNVTEAAKVLTEDHVGIYLTVSYPYSVLSNQMKQKGVDTDSIFFMDAITKTISGKPEKTQNCLYMASPTSLTEMGIAVTHAMEALPGNKKFFFLDSLSTLLIYNGPYRVARFSHVIINKVKLLKFKGVLSTVEKESDKNFLRQLIPLCSKTIRV